MRRGIVPRVKPSKVLPPLVCRRSTLPCGVICRDTPVGFMWIRIDSGVLSFVVVRPLVFFFGRTYFVVMVFASLKWRTRGWSITQEPQHPPLSSLFSLTLDSTCLAMPCHALPCHALLCLEFSGPTLKEQERASRGRSLPRLPRPLRQ